MSGNGEVSQVGAALAALDTEIPGVPVSGSMNDLVKDIVGATLAGNHREKVYPYDTVGALATPGNGAWGDTAVLVPVDAITDDYGWDGGSPAAYNIVAILAMLEAVGGVGDPFTWQAIRIAKSTAQVLDGDAAAAQKIIPVPLTGDFAVDDWVWIVDDDTAAGELAKIASIQTDVSITTVDNLVGAYSTGQNAVVYLGRRAGGGEHSALWEKTSIADVKDMRRFLLHAPRSMEAGDGLVVRTYGIDNADPTARFSIAFDTP